jgi:hypothetical protein
MVSNHYNYNIRSSHLDKWLCILLNMSTLKMKCRNWNLKKLNVCMEQREDVLKSIVKYGGHPNCMKFVFHACYLRTQCVIIYIYIYIYIYVHLSTQVNKTRTLMQMYMFTFPHIHNKHLWEPVVSARSKKKSSQLNSWENLQLFLSCMPTIEASIKICQYENMSNYRHTLPRN